jgi:hypothetical protein
VPEPIESNKVEGESHDENHAIVLDENKEEDEILQPTPEFPISNPLLKFMLELPPPTPRDSSPMQQALKDMHPANVDEEPTSPVDRKEEDVMPPTSICNFIPANVDEPSRQGNLPTTQILNYRRGRASHKRGRYFTKNG